MFLSRRLLTSTVMALLFGGLLVPSALATQPNNKVPLKGDFVGIGAEFSGNFSHLGAFTGVVDLAGGEDTVWVAANGDTVTNQTTSFVIDFGDFSSFPVFPYEQTIVITGGTGRFHDATGSATITGSFNVVTVEYDGQLSGTISQPGPRH